MLGKSYIIQHCVAFLKKKTKEEAYRIYVTDALMVIAENTSRFNGGREMTMRYADLISEEKPEERTEADIINGIKEKMRKMGNGSV